MEVFETKPLSFALEKADFEDEQRIDVRYFHPKYLDDLKRLKSSKYPLKTLDEISDMIKDGPHQSPSSYVSDGIPFLEKGDVKEGEIDLNRAKKISKEFHDANPLTQAKPNDILIRKIGVGPREAAVVPPHSPPLHFFVSLASIRLRKEYNPHYVEIFLNSSLGRSQTERRNKSIGTPDLHLEDLRTVLVPIPPARIQNGIIIKIQSARRKRRELLARCQRLRRSIETKLNRELGLVQIVSEPITFYVAQKIGNRLDAPYYNPIHQKILKQLERSKFEKVQLGHLAVFQKKRVDPVKDFPDSTIRYIQIQDIDEDNNAIVSRSEVLGRDVSSRARIPVESNDILVPVLGGSSTSIAIVPRAFTGAIASTGFEVLRAKDENMTLYLAKFLTTPYAQLQIERELTGSIMASISRDKLGNILVPKPDAETVNRISKFISQTQKEIDRLQIRANAIVIDAKEEVEPLFLG